MILAIYETFFLARPKEISSLDFVRMKKVNDHFIYFEERELKKGKSEQKFVSILYFKKSSVMFDPTHT